MGVLEGTKKLQFPRALVRLHESVYGENSDQNVYV
jgi:hypothetical protein